MSIHINAGSTTVDVSTPVNVVASAYATSGNGGRKLVRLSNGWVVATAYQSSNFRYHVYVNKFDGNGFTEICYFTGTVAPTGFALAAYGTRVTLMVGADNGASSIAVGTCTFDVLTASGELSSLWKYLDNTPTLTRAGQVSIAAHTDGTLHAAWASKNATYPNSFNIRYSKSTDGGLTWAAATQITKLNNIYYNYSIPCIIVDIIGKPFITCAFDDAYNRGGGNDSTIPRFVFNGSTWTEGVIFTTSNLYPPTNPCATVAPNGYIQTVWQGKDATDSAKFNIWYSQSVDGTTWSTPIKLTTGNTYDQLSPSVACRSDGRIYVMWHGQHAGSTTYTQIRQRYYGLPDIGGGGIDWQGISNLTSASAHQTNVQTCETVNTFQDYPLHIWADAGGSVKFRGAWTVSGIKTVTQASVNVPASTVDVSTPVNVVGSAYDTSGNGGRKLVRLSNGWLVSSVYDSTSKYIRLYVNKFDGNGFNQLCYRSGLSTYYVAHAIAAVGNKVHLLVNLTGSVYAYAIDVPTMTNADIYTGTETNLDSTMSNSTVGCSLAAHTDGTLHAAWASKNSTYPNSFNIRYSKSTDGGATWATPTQLTTYNSANRYGKAPCLIVKTDGNPLFVMEGNYDNSYFIGGLTHNGTSWQAFAGSGPLYSGGSYVQAKPCATVAPDGTIHVVWDGMDSTDSAQSNIRYSKSTDGGATWSAAVKLTTGNTYAQGNASITCDSSNNVHVVFDGKGAGFTTYNRIRYIKCTAGAWGAVSELTTNTTAINAFASVCDNHKNFTDPLMIWRDNQSPSVKFRGVWQTGGWKPATAYVNTGASGDFTPIPTGAVFGLHFDGNTNDFIGSLVPESNTGTFDTVNKKFGTASMAFNGSQALTYADSEIWNLGSGDFYFDLWVRPTSNTLMFMFGQTPTNAASANSSCALQKTANTNTVEFYVFIGGTQYFARAAGTLSLGAIQHIRCGRAGNNIYCAIDGGVGSPAAVSGTINNSTAKFAFGNWGEYNAENLRWQGNIDEPILVKGQPMNTTNFTPPQYPYGTGAWKQV